jgi:hypothetical protein
MAAAGPFALVPSSNQNQQAPTALSGVVPIASASLTDVVILQPKGFGNLLLTCTTGTNALTNLALTRACAPGGTHVPFVSGAAINTGTNATALTPGSFLESSMVSPYLATAGVSFQLLVTVKSGQEWKVQAATGTGTNAGSLAVEACLFDANV